MVLGEAPFPPRGLGRGVVARHDHDEDLVATQPPPDEHERAAAGVVDPPGVVDDDDHRAAGLQPPEHGEQFGAHGQRIGVGWRPRGEQRRTLPAGHLGDELGHDAEREPGLTLLTAGPEHADPGPAGEEVADERGLPDAGGTADPQDTRLPGPDPVELGPHRRELADPADEGAVPHTRQFVATGPGGEPASPRRGEGLTHRERGRRGDALARGLAPTLNP